MFPIELPIWILSSVPWGTVWGYPVQSGGTLGFGVVSPGHFYQSLCSLCSFSQEPFSLLLDKKR